MPLARRTYQNHFWAKNGSTSSSPAALLAKFLGVDINTRQPGFPVADTGWFSNKFEYTSPAPVGVLRTLNGKGSVFATGYQWTMTSRPIGSAAVLTGATTATPAFTPDVGGLYTFSLVVNNAKGVSTAAFAQVIMSAFVPPFPASFRNDFRTACAFSACHQNNRGPNYSNGFYTTDRYFVDYNIFYRRLIERIDFNDVSNSLVVRKLHGDVPHAGGVLDINLMSMMRWIYEGAPNN